MESWQFRVRLTPRASRDRLENWDGEILRARVSAPPIQGKANAALLRLLSEALDVSKSRLAIVKGKASRDKVVAVEGLSEEEARRRLRSATPKEGAGG